MVFAKMYIFGLTFVITHILVKQGIAVATQKNYEVDIIHGEYSTNITVNISSSREALIRFPDSTSLLPYTVYAWSYQIDPPFPVFIMVRQQKEETSWEIPLLVKSQEGTSYFFKTSRTLCHNSMKKISKKMENKSHVQNHFMELHKELMISVSTAYTLPINATIRVEEEEGFYLKESQNYSAIISPSEPRYFYYKFPDNDYADHEATAILEVDSPDQTCLTVSIQPATCPVFDLNQDISYEGKYETVNTKGGLIIKEAEFPNGLFVVLVAKGDNFDCDKRDTVIPVQESSNIVVMSNYSSVVKFTIRPSVSQDRCIVMTLVTILGFLTFYVIFWSVYCEFCSSDRSCRAHIIHGYQYLPGTVSMDAFSVNTTTEDNQDSSARNNLGFVFVEDNSSKPSTSKKGVNDHSESSNRTKTSYQGLINVKEKRYSVQYNAYQGKVDESINDCNPDTGATKKKIDGKPKKCRRVKERQYLVPDGSIKIDVITNKKIGLSSKVYSSKGGESQDETSDCENEGIKSDSYLINIKESEYQLPNASINVDFSTNCADSVTPDIGTLSNTKHVMNENYRQGNLEVFEDMDLNEILEDQQPPTDTIGNEDLPTSGIGNDQLPTNAVQNNQQSSNGGAAVDVYRNINKKLLRPQLYLSDLATRESRRIHQESVNYFLHVISIGIFYGIPVVQLAVTNQRMVDITGNLDKCYYNFLCAHPFLGFSDYNHVLSNSGYLLLGILFATITRSHKKMRPDNNLGIPKHYGLYYAMAAALIMEGLLSGCYHVCPNQSNFQFDTSFMYVMAVLCIIKLYQNRHPDINATAYITFLILAIAVLIAMVGILNGHIAIWIGFIVAYWLLCLWVATNIYYLNDYKGGYQLIRLTIKHEGYRKLMHPIRRERCIIVVTITLLNVILSGLGLVCRSYNWGFGIFLLALLMSNALIYVGTYVVMKLKCGEKMTCQFVVYSIITAVLWSFALHYFINNSSDWMVTAAESKQWNTRCKMFNFYDNHDIWHLISATALFFSFMMLLTVDDELVNTPRDAIEVF